MSSPTLFQNIAGDPLNFWRGQALNLRKVRDFANLSNKDISRMAGVAPTSVRFDDKVPVEVLEHMENIANVCNLVFEFFQDDVKTKLWAADAESAAGQHLPEGHDPRGTLQEAAAVRHGRFAGGRGNTCRSAPKKGAGLDIDSAKGRFTVLDSQTCKESERAW